MAAIVKPHGMKPVDLLTQKATRAGVLVGLCAAAKKLKAGDSFFLTLRATGFWQA